MEGRPKIVTEIESWKRRSEKVKRELECANGEPCACQSDDKSECHDDDVCLLLGQMNELLERLVVVCEVHAKAYLRTLASGG
jgi:hypothetical protein